MGGRGSASYVPKGIPSGGSTGADNYSTGTLNVKPITSMRGALGKEGRKMSVARAVAGANPYYSASYSEFSENCQRAVVAVESRMRGYNVVAQPTFKGDKLPQLVQAPNGDLNGRWQGAFKGAKSVKVAGNSAESTAKNVNNLMKSYGNGARGVIAVQWKNGGGHVVNVVNKNGRIYYVDGQVNKRYSGKDLFSKTKLSYSTLVRTDNLDFSSRITKFVEPTGYRTGTTAKATKRSKKT